MKINYFIYPGLNNIIIYSLNEIETILCNYFYINREFIYSKNKRIEAVISRQILSYWYYIKYKEMSLNDIKNKFKFKTHNSILYAIKQIKNDNYIRDIFYKIFNYLP